MEYRLPLCWRISKAEDFTGFFMYFDASREVPALRALTEDEKSLTLDKHGSVSELIRSDQLEDQDGCNGASRSLRGPSFVQLDFIREVSDE